MDTSVLTPHFFNLWYFILLILLTITLCARCFHCDLEGLIAFARLVLWRTLGGVMGMTLGASLLQ